MSSQLVEVEAFRAVDRERLLGHLDDTQTATKRKELTDFLDMLDLAAIDRAVIARAKSPFAVNVRALDAIHVATAEILAEEASEEPLEFWTHDDARLHELPRQGRLGELQQALGRPGSLGIRTSPRTFSSASAAKRGRRFTSSKDRG